MNVARVSPPLRCGRQFRGRKFANLTRGSPNGSGGSVEIAATGNFFRDEVVILARCDRRGELPLAGF